MNDNNNDKGFSLAEVAILIAIVACLLAIAIPHFVAYKQGYKQRQLLTSGVKKTDIQVQTQADSGMTIEQENIAKRLKEDNKPGAIKHLYVISAYSGQVIIYSTVKGKVTSSGKRHNPYEVIGGSGGPSDYFTIDIANQAHRTKEVLQDDGTYGHSEPYIFWWDTKDVYHQHFVSGGQIIHVSNQPLVVKSVIINMEMK